MEKIYIVTAGDSFTDSHMPVITTDDRNTQYGLYHKLVTQREELLAPDYALKYQYYLIYELIEKRKPFDFYNVGKGSAGNHVIVNYYKNKINELLENGVDPKKIYGTIQLSGLCRSTDPTYDIEFDLKNVPGGEWDYINDIHKTSSNYAEVLKKHIENIENVISWNKDRGIENFKIFFGWAVYFEDELREFDLLQRFENIDKNYLYLHTYPESNDIFRSNCVGYKKLLSEIFGDKGFKIAGGKYGGMTEIAKENCEDNNQPYVSFFDQHLNTFGNYTFYKKFYRDLFVKWGVIDDNNEIENDKELWDYLQFVFKANFKMFKKTENNEMFRDAGNVPYSIKDKIKIDFYNEYLSLNKNH